MPATRRELLRKLMIGGAAVAAGTALPGVVTQAHAEEAATAPVEAVGLLYDATKCVGCQSCVYACAAANGVEPDATADSLHYTNFDLSSFTKNIIKLYKPADGSAYSFVKRQCMHCVDPACVSGCPFQALKKNEKNGIVGWDGGKCVGCRYCEIACPYNVPKFQWSGMNPKIVKCELCKERLAVGKQPACTSACPVGAVIFGKREDLLKEAKQRIKDNPGRYYQNRVYGEVEGGGTQALYLSHVAFEKLGLPDLGDESVPRKYMKWQKRVYSYMVLPTAIYAGLATIIKRNFRHELAEKQEEEKKTGLRPQL